jgi:regulator of protease activity HflC (stomatin/prohibitin superfamily)
MKQLNLVPAVVAALIAVACGRIETGNVGVRTDFNKTVETEEVAPGWYGALFTSVSEFTVKEIEVAMNDMRPKAKDNLSLADMDVSIFYKPNPELVADTYIKYSGMSAVSNGVGFPAYTLIERFSRGAIYDTVAQYDSLTIHTKRNELEQAIGDRIQFDLDKGDKGTFQITKVIVRQLVTDPALEKSIQQNVQVQKDTEAKEGQIKLARAEAERLRVEAEGQARANRLIADSITPQLVELRRIEAMKSFAGAGTHTVVLPSDSRSMINIGK